MTKITFVFPGQGSQSVGMGTALLERFPEVRSLYDEAQQILGWDLRLLCATGPEDRLRQTDIAQPALYVTGYAAFRALTLSGIQPDAAAGHSIGEYAALAAAGVFSFGEGLAMVRERGRLMQLAAQKYPGTMMAILGISGDQVKDICRQVQPKGICTAVNFNSPEQTVIAGEKSALEEAGKLAQASGAKRVLPLNVSGAFHSPLMKEAADSMRLMLSKIPFQNAQIPVALNVDGQLHQSGGEIQVLLSQQLDHSVQWVRSIQTLMENGFSVFVEAGAGKVLVGLIRRIHKTAQIFTTETAESFQQTIETLHPIQKGIL